jgi:hypothetical protein
MWSLTVPQVAATLAATLVAFHAFDAVGQRLIDRRRLDGLVRWSIAHPCVSYWGNVSTT